MSDIKEIATTSVKISVDSSNLDKLEAQLKRIAGNPIIQAVWKFKVSALQDSKSLAVISELTASKDGIHDTCLYCSIRCSTV